MAELSETHPRNFTSEGISPKYKGRAEYYGIDDYDKAQKFRESGESKEACEVVSAKQFDGVKSAQRQRPPAENANAQPQYKLMSDDISVTDSILSPNVQGRRPMVVKTVLNEQQALQHNIGTAQAHSVQHGSRSQTAINIQQQPPVRHDVQMTHVQNISVGSTSQTPANIRTQQVVQQNARPMHTQASAVTQQPQKPVKYNANTAQNFETQAPSVIQPKTVVIQSQTTVVQAPAVNQQPHPPVQQTPAIMHVEKAPTVVAPVAAAPKEEGKQPAHRRVRPTRAEAKAQAVGSHQTSSVTVESKPISAAPDLVQEVPKQDIQDDVKIEQTAEEVQTPMTDADTENKNENVTEMADVEIASQEAIVPEVAEEKDSAQARTKEEQGNSINEVQQPQSTEPISAAQENEPPTKTLEPPIQVQEEPTPTDKLQTLPAPEASDFIANENVDDTKEEEVKEPLESEVEIKAGTTENTETASMENNINSNIELESQTEIVETIEVSEEKSQTELKEDVSESITIDNEPESESIQKIENEVNIETAEASLNVEMAVETENSQEIIIQSAPDNETKNTEDAESFTLKLDGDINEETGVSISMDSAEVVIETTNIEISSEVDTAAAEPTESMADVNLVVSEENINTEASADVNLSLNEENIANVTIGLAEEKPEQPSVENDDAVEFSISLNEETTSDKSDNKTEQKSNENVAGWQTENAVSDKDLKIDEKESTDKKVENKISNKEDMKDAKPVAEKARAKTENKDSKSKVSPPQNDKDDKKSAPWRSRKTNFVDSQGGVQARLQRLQKK